MQKRHGRRLLAVLAVVGCLVAAGQPEALAAYPGRNGNIAFEFGEKLRSAHVFTMDSSGEHRRAVDRPGARWEPTWSPDGRMIAYYKPGYHLFQQSWDGFLRIMRPNGDRVGTVAAFAPIGGDMSWSPNARRIVLTSFLSCQDNDGWYRIAIVRVRDGECLFATRGATVKYDPAWSPNGRRIAFIKGERGNIFTMRPDGRRTDRVTDTATFKRSPDWAPDGSRIVFISDGDVAVVGARGGPITMLTDTAREESDVVFSPNGRRIAFDRCCYGPNDVSKIFKMRLDGSAERVLGRGSNPDWQPLPR